MIVVSKAKTKSGPARHDHHGHEHGYHHGHDHDDREAVDVRKMLQGVGLKITAPRQAIMDILVDRHGPFTAEELHQIIIKNKETGNCDLVTIYRCLSKFESLGLISRCDFGDGSVRYELRRDDHHHHHIICRICKRVEPLSICPVDDKSIRMPKMGFKDVTHRLEFFGVCPDCHAETKHR